MATAIVNKIIPSSVVDGRGNRTAIFLQGCNLKCAYCHNPETQNLCINCGECVRVCKTGALSIKDGLVCYDPHKCVDCDSCVATCTHYATPKTQEMSASEVYDKVKKGLAFIRGITVSGGECTLYPEFLYELFTFANADHLGCLIDSNGKIDLSLYPDLIDICEGVMLDVKSWDNDVFKALTGYDNDIMKKNIEYLSQKDKLAEVRIVTIEDEVDAKDALTGIASILSKQENGEEKINNLLVKLIRFRNIGVKGRLSKTPTPSLEYMIEIQNHACSLGFENVVII